MTTTERQHWMGLCDEAEESVRARFLELREGLRVDACDTDYAAALLMFAMMHAGSLLAKLQRVLDAERRREEGAG